MDILTTIKPKQQNQFKIWVDTYNDDYTGKDHLDDSISQRVDKFIKSEVDNEGTYYADVIITKISQIQDLGLYFDETIIMFGDTFNDIAPKSTLEELGMI